MQLRIAISWNAYFYLSFRILPLTVPVAIEQVACASATNVQFRAATNYAVGYKPGTLVAADFNHDGKLDLATANFDSDTVSVLLGLGDGTFARPTNYATADAPLSLAVGDFDNDSHPDIVALCGVSGSFLRGNGAGAFLVSSFAQADFPRSVAAADFDNNGKLDLATSRITVVFGRGNGSFTNAGYFPLDMGSDVATGDMNGDSHLDIVASHYGSFVTTATNKGNGTFGPLVLRPGPGVSGGRELMLDDVNEDGKLDVMLTTGYDLMIWTNAGGDVLYASNVITAGIGGLSSLGRGDFNRDGRTDWVVRGSASLRLIIKNPDNSFSLGAVVPVPFPSVIPSRKTIVVADFNNDSKPDIALTTIANAISVLINETPTGHLNITASAGQVQVAWLASSNVVFQLETSANLAVSNSWQPFPSTPVQNGNLRSVTDFALGEQKFYRLRKP